MYDNNIYYPLYVLLFSAVAVLADYVIVIWTQSFHYTIWSNHLVFFHHDYHACHDLTIMDNIHSIVFARFDSSHAKRRCDPSYSFFVSCSLHIFVSQQDIACALNKNQMNDLHEFNGTKNHSPHAWPFQSASFHSLVVLYELCSWAASRRHGKTAHNSWLWIIFIDINHVLKHPVLNKILIQQHQMVLTTGSLS